VRKARLAQVTSDPGIQGLGRQHGFDAAVRPGLDAADAANKMQRIVWHRLPGESEGSEEGWLVPCVKIFGM